MEHLLTHLRPHTNLTEIDEGLSLLWRAGLSAANVILGLGFYGRSFTLSDPSCSKPWCTFSEGGKAGECTAAAGILSSAEISRIIDANSLEPGYDEKAAVKWIHWNTNQWVSYDDEETFVAKSVYANNLGLSGVMVWAIDQGVSGKTNSDLVGSNLVLKRAGYNSADIVTFQDYVDAGDTCYVSFCGETCKTGYTPTTQMRGEVGELGPGSACVGDKLQTLCCQNGAFLGRCSWGGWRGQGLSCYSGTFSKAPSKDWVMLTLIGGCPAGDTLVTINTNHYDSVPEAHFLEDRTCNVSFKSCSMLI